MKSNTEIVRDVLEQVVNQKRIEAWDQYFSPDYIARGAPFIGLGFSRDTSENKHTINAILPGSPAEGKLRVGDELLWVEDDRQRWTTHEGISEGLQRHRGNRLNAGVRRGQRTLEVDLTRGLIRGFDTGNDQAKSEMQQFMTQEIPDLSVDVKLTLADGDMVVCLMEYRGTHAALGREAIWREAWFVRLFEGKIVESWPLPDIDAYCRQLGYQLIPPGD
jgi:ketosteroid isomerase-like protein